MKRISIVTAIFCFAVCAFAQSTEYSKYLSKAKEYESKKQWAFALDAYYDAIGCDDEPSAKTDALNGYLALSEAIKSGNPGLGKYNAFSVHDEWKKLLIDAEKLGSSICKFALRLGKLEQGDLDYKTHTASYKSKVQVEISDRYAKTVAVVEEGYKAAYKSDWNDLPKPENWPLYSVSSAKNAVYDVNGAKILEVPSRWKNNPSDYYNAFAVFSWDDSFYDFKKYPASGMHPASRSLYDYKCNIVDENGNELVKGKRWLLSCKEKDEGKLSAVEIVLDGVPPAVMELLDSGKAFINPVAVYLEYGKYNYDDDKGKRTFIKNFPEVQLDMSKSMIYCWNKIEDLHAIRFNEAVHKNITVPLVKAYFEMIYTNGTLDDNSSTLLFKIPLDEAYDGHGNFTLKATSGNELKVSKDDFLATVKEMTGQEYLIDDYQRPYCLQRIATDEEKTAYGNRNSDAVKSYFKVISVKGTLDDSTRTLSFKIPLGEAYDGHGNFILKATSGNELKVNEDDFLAILKNLTNQVYWIEQNSLVRNASEKEKSEFDAKRKAQKDSENEILIEKILAFKPSSYGMRGYAEYEYGSVSVLFNGNSYGKSRQVSDVIRMYAVLNKASEKLGYKPCYYQEQNGNRIYDPEKWNLGTFEIDGLGLCKWKNADSIKEDRTTGGFYCERYISDNMRIFRRK